MWLRAYRPDSIPLSTRLSAISLSRSLETGVVSVWTFSWRQVTALICSPHRLWHMRGRSPSNVPSRGVSPHGAASSIDHLKLPTQLRREFTEAWPRLMKNLGDSFEVIPLGCKCRYAVCSFHSHEFGQSLMWRDLGQVGEFNIGPSRRLLGWIVRSELSQELLLVTGPKWLAPSVSIDTARHNPNWATRTEKWLETFVCQQKRTSIHHGMVLFGGDLVGAVAGSRALIASELGHSALVYPGRERQTTPLRSGGLGRPDTTIDPAQSCREAGSRSVFRDNTVKETHH